MDKPPPIKRLETINKIIGEYKQANLKSKYDDLSDLHNDALIKSLTVRALNAIEAEVGKDTAYYKQAYHSDGRPVHVGELIGILEALKSDILDGNHLARKPITSPESANKNSKSGISLQSILSLRQIIGIICAIFSAGFLLGLLAPRFPWAKNVLIHIPGYRSFFTLPESTAQRLDAQLERVVAAYNVRLERLNAQLLYEERMAADESIVWAPSREEHAKAAQRIREDIGGERDSFRQDLDALKDLRD